MRLRRSGKSGIPFDCSIASRVLWRHAQPYPAVPNGKPGRGKTPRRIGGAALAPVSAADPEDTRPATAQEARMETLKAMARDVVHAPSDSLAHKRRQQAQPVPDAVTESVTIIPTKEFVTPVT